MVGLAAVCWGLWKARNNIYFGNKIIRSPTEITCSISSFVTYWADLQKVEGQESLKDGAEALKETALQLY